MGLGAGREQEVQPFYTALCEVLRRYSSERVHLRHPTCTLDRHLIYCGQYTVHCGQWNILKSIHCGLSRVDSNEFQVDNLLWTKKVPVIKNIFRDVLDRHEL